jgi:hypothetical protein
METKSIILENNINGTNFRPLESILLPQKVEPNIH